MGLLRQVVLAHLRSVVDRWYRDPERGFARLVDQIERLRALQ